MKTCPVKAIKVDSATEFPEILPQRCIGCGSCVTACPTQTIPYRDSIAEVKALISSGKRSAAIVDPSISGEFPDITDYRKFVEMIRSLGFTYVLETSFGVDLVAVKYRELYDDFRGKYYIMANCPAVVSYISKYHPELIPNLAPIVSPMIAMTLVARKKMGPDLKVVSIGPCIAAKDEALLYEGEARPDAVLTFTELRKMFNDAGITESTLEFSEFDPPLGYKGALYPISHGIIQAAGLNEDLLTGSIITTEGKQNMLDAGKEFASRIDLIRRNFNLFYDEGCMMGPGMSPHGEKFLRHTLVTDYVNKRIKSIDLSVWKNNTDKFLSLHLERGFAADDQRLPVPSEDQINDILKSIEKDYGQTGIGCESCGYASCRDFAIAVSQGLATTEMCSLYSSKNRQEYIKTLRTTNEKLAKIQAALRDSEQKARKDEETAKDANETIGALLQKLPVGVLIVDEKLKVVHANKAVITILGDEASLIDEVIPGLMGADLKSLLPVAFYKLFSYVIESEDTISNRDLHIGDRLYNTSVFPVGKRKFAGAIIRDMYLPEVQKEQVVRRLDEVVTENLHMVQKIAFLLGEGAASTEKMLNSIIESYKSQEKHE